MDFEELMVYEKKLLYTPLSCGKHLLELSTYQDIALWWFVDWSFHYSLMRIKKEESQEITSVVGKVIPINVTRFFYRFVVDRIDFVIKYTSFLLYILFRKSLPNRKISDKKKVILFTGEDIEWRPVLDISSGKQKKQDQFFSSLISTLQKKNYVLISTYDVRFPFYKSFSTVVDKLQHWDVLHVPFGLDIFGEERAERVSLDRVQAIGGDRWRGRRRCCRGCRGGSGYWVHLFLPF